MSNLKYSDWVRMVVQSSPEFQFSLQDANLLEQVDPVEVLNAYINNIYKQYISKYPEVERASFITKAKEARLVVQDPTISLDETPYLSMLVNNDINKRNDLAIAIVKKVKFVARLERFGAIYRKILRTEYEKWRYEHATNEQKNEMFVEYIERKNINYDFYEWHKSNIDDANILSQGSENE